MTGLDHTTSVNDFLTAEDPGDAVVTQLRDQLGRAHAAASTHNLVAIVELARIAQAARSTTETVSEAFDAGRQHVLDLIERRLVQLRGKGTRDPKVAR